MNEEPEYSVKSYLLYKLDRTIAITGIVLLGGWALLIKTPEATNVAMAALGGLVG